MMLSFLMHCVFPYMDLLYKTCFQKAELFLFQRSSKLDTVFINYWFNHNYLSETSYHAYIDSLRHYHLQFIIIRLQCLTGTQHNR